MWKNAFLILTIFCSLASQYSFLFRVFLYSWQICQMRRLAKFWVLTVLSGVSMMITPLFYFLGTFYRYITLVLSQLFVNHFGNCLFCAIILTGRLN